MRSEKKTLNALNWDREFALEQTAGDEELLAELMVLFKDSAADDLINLKEAINDDSPANVVSAAHSLKGSAASLGIESVRKLASEMEEDGRNGSISKARDGLVGMEALLEEVNRL